ncbi:MAG TPA: LpqB family beta-propeller domain-containing protein [Thermoanaerobaculia bacterium]|nr:LpqB family beta-propeller domain-containing protein [Thermoanaerobaculia bacterium]
MSRAPEEAFGGEAGHDSDFRIGDRVIQPRLNRVSTPAETIQLEPKIMRVLRCLAESPGEVVSKERLFAEVWQGTYVSEDVLTRAIAELRRVFEDSAADPRVIETIRKSGYRLLILPESVPKTGFGDDSLPGIRRPKPALIRAALAAVALAVVLATSAVYLWSRRQPSASHAPMRIRPLTSLPGNQRDPAISPDGTRVAFVWNGGSGDAYSLYVQLVDSESPLRLTREPGVEDRVPAWSPDGQKLAFTRATAAGCSILVISSLGGAEHTAGPCGDRDYRRLAWSPDGTWLAFSRRDGRSRLVIELMGVETGEQRAVTRPPEGILGDSSPSFSPDGDWLAFTRNITEGVSDVFTVGLDGNGEKRLTFDDRDTMGVGWSADGKSLVFSSSRAGIYSLWRVAASGGEPTFVAGGGVKIKHPSSSRGRDSIAFENWLYELNLWTVPTGGGAPRPLTRTTDQWNFQPEVSPDGRRIAFVSTRSGSEEVWVADADGSSPRRLTSFGGARLESASWSPDGRRIVFSGRRPARADLWAVSAEGGAPEQLTSGPGDSLAPSWSRDGRAVYFASSRSGSWEVWKLVLADRRAAAVTAGGGYRAREGPDGRTLYFTRPGAAGIWSQPAGGGAPERVVEGLAPEDWGNWDVGSRGIYFRRAAGNRAVVALLAFGAREAEDFAPLSQQGWCGFSVSADGRSLVYSRVDRQSCDIRLIENPR